ncbi:MAG TPA: hypothetical protein RMH99_24800 [Sandaracinaceae bacterium LLY-WYZ-13_1]|nr:hypothetical protein [Sandaracinaceae bacterium LLY-WYZ-13_1]
MKTVVRCMMVLALLVGCDGDDDADGGVDAGGSDAGATDGGPEADAATDAGAPDAGPDCSAFEDDPCNGPPACRTEVEVSGDITEDTTWTCENIYVLTDFVFVHRPNGSPDTDPRVTLTIEAGTLVRGQGGDIDATPVDLPGALIVTREGMLEANGTADQPVVFTSAEPVGTRSPGDWAGLALLGGASTNLAEGQKRLEGLPSSVPDAYAVYGAPAAEADDTWNCGTLSYVRVEYASFTLADDKELNGLTVGACGEETDMHHVQIHRAQDDGIEFFGGRVDVDHLVVTGAQDDGIDWDEGFTGRIQFAVVQQWADVSADGNGIEADGLASGGVATPVSDPRVFNVTLLGTDDGNGKLGMRLRDGTRGYLRNFVIAGFAEGVFDVQGDSEGEASADELTVEHSILVSTDVGGTEVLFPSDGTLIEFDHFVADPDRDNTSLDSDEIGTVLPSPFDTASPGWVPNADSLPDTHPAETPSEAVGETRPGFFDTSAAYVGAFEPGGTDWTEGWTTRDDG